MCGLPVTVVLPARCRQGLWRHHLGVLTSPVQSHRLSYKAGLHQSREFILCLNTQPSKGGTWRSLSCERWEGLCEVHHLCCAAGQFRLALRWLNFLRLVEASAVMCCHGVEAVKRLFPPDPLVLVFPGCGVSCCGTALFNFLSQSCCGTEVYFQACPCSCSCSTGGCRASGPAAEVLCLFLVKGGGFGADEDLVRHLSKLSFGFVAKLTRTGCKLAQGIPSKIEKRGVILILSRDMYSFIYFIFFLLLLSGKLS